jgi:LysM repeat protein
MKNNLVANSAKGMIALAIIVAFTSIALVQGQGSTLLAQSPISPLPTYPATRSPLPTPIPLPPATPPSGTTPVPTPTSPAPGSRPTQPPPAAGILGYHTVRSGETLFCIGRAYAVLPWAIANQNKIAAPDNVWIGQRLAIPNVPWVKTYGPVCARQFGTGTPAPLPCRAMHKVYFDDTLYSLAQHYKTTVWAIAHANNIRNANLIFVGQTLCIP